MARAPVAAVSATPASPPPTTVLPASSGHANDLARTLLLTFAILFLLLAAAPWRYVFQYNVVPAQVARLRVTFVVISLSVAFGYVIAFYLNGAN